VSYPGAGYDTPLAVLVEAMWRVSASSDGWVTVIVPGCVHADGDQIRMQATPKSVNMMLRALPDKFARDLGLTRTGEGLYEVKDANPEVMGFVLDSILRSYFFQQDEYAVECVVES